MYSLNYGLGKSIDLYQDLISDYRMFYAMLIAALVLGFIMIINTEGHNNIILTVAFNILSLFLILNHFGLELINNLDSCLNGDFIGNICLFFVNTMFVMILVSSFLTSSRYNYYSRITLIILYLIMFLNMSFALYITYRINANILITIGNIYPMVIIGNIISIIVYVYLFVLTIVTKISKQYDKKKHLLYR